MIKRQPWNRVSLGIVIQFLLIIGGGLVYGSDHTTSEIKSIQRASTLETANEQLQDMTPLIDYKFVSNPIKSAVTWTIGLGTNLFVTLMGVTAATGKSSLVDLAVGRSKFSEVFGAGQNYLHTTWINYTMPWEEFKAVRTFLSGETIHNRDAYIQEILNRILPEPKEFEFVKDHVKTSYHFALKRAVKERRYAIVQYELWDEEFYKLLDETFLNELGHFLCRETSAPFQLDPFARARLMAWAVVSYQSSDITTKIEWSREKQIHGAINNAFQYELARINAQQRKERWATKFSPPVRNAIADWLVDEQDAKTYDDESKMFEFFYQIQTHGLDTNVMDDIRMVLTLDPEFTEPCPELGNMDVIKNAGDILMENKTYDFQTVGNTEQDADMEIFFWGEIKRYNVERFRESLIDHPSPWIQAIGYHYPTFKRILCYVIHQCTQGQQKI